MAEDSVLNFLRQQNRPYNAQGVTDHLAQFGVKKAQAQRALDALVESGKVICKEFGKTKIYIIVQDDKDDLSKEEMETLQQRSAQLAEQLQRKSEEVQQKKKALQDLECTLTGEQLDARLAELQEQVTQAQGRLHALKAGTRLISAEERGKVEKGFTEAMHAWVKRKGIFKSIWSQVSENLDRKTSELWEEMGVETDEEAGVEMSTLQQLLPKKARR